MLQRQSVLSTITSVFDFLVLVLCSFPNKQKLVSMPVSVWTYINHNVLHAYTQRNIFKWMKRTFLAFFLFLLLFLPTYSGKRFHKHYWEALKRVGVFEWFLIPKETFTSENEFNHRIFFLHGFCYIKEFIFLFRIC